MLFNSTKILYLTNWDYNACRLMTRLAKVVEDAGGKVDYRPMCHGHIVNRSITGSIRDLEKHLGKVEMHLDDKSDLERYNARIEYYREKREMLERYKAIDNSPLEVTHTTWINFVLNGVHYSYNLDDNPFFPFHYSKTPVFNGKYNASVYSNQDKKEWLYDCFFKFDCSVEDIKEGANLIFNLLLNAPMSHKAGSRIVERKVEF